LRCGVAILYDLDGISPGGYTMAQAWEVEVSDEFIEWYDSLVS